MKTNGVALALVLASVLSCASDDEDDDHCCILPAGVEDCQNRGGTNQNRSMSQSGGEYGVCAFPDGSECIPTDLGPGFCKPGDCKRAELRFDAKGYLQRVCVFADATECEMSDFSAGRCKAGDCLSVAVCRPDLWPQDAGAESAVDAKLDVQAGD